MRPEPESPHVSSFFFPFRAVGNLVAAGLLLLAPLSGAAAAAGQVAGQTAETQPAEDQGAETENPTAEPSELPTVRDELTVRGNRSDSYAAPTASSFKTPTPLRLIPQSAQVVTRSVLLDQEPYSLADAVRNVAGAAEDFGFNGSAQPLLILRGFQMTSMTASGSMSGMSSYYLDGTKVQGVPINMANVESVEVLKGPASVLYGRGEPGGIVNVVTRTAQAERGVGLFQMVDSQGSSQTLAEVTGALDRGKRFLGRIAATYSDLDTDRDFVEDRLGALDGNLSWFPDDKTRLSLTVGHSDQRYRNDFGIPALGDRPASLPRSRQYNDAPELSRIRTNSVLLGFERNLGTRWTVKGRAVDTRSRTREVDVWPYRIDLATGEDCVETRNQLCRYYFFVRPDGRYRASQVALDLVGIFETGSVGHEILSGVDHYTTSKKGRTYLEFLTPVDVESPELGNTPGLDVSQAIPSDFQDESRWTSVYVQDRMAFGAGFHLVAGLRYDRTEAVFAMPGTPPNEQSFTTPRLGLVKELSDRQSLYLQYQEAVAANNGRDPASGRALDSETAQQMEVGYKVASSSGRFQATLAAYQLVKENRSDYSLFPIVQTIGEARSRGIELDASGQWSDRLALLGSLAYTDAEVTEDPLYEGTRLANVPRRSGSLWARYLLTPRWAVGGGAFYQDRREGDQANSFVLPSYVRVDAMVSYDVRLRGLPTTFQLSLDNAFDRRHYTGSHPLVRDWIQPGRRRTFSLTLRLNV